MLRQEPDWGSSATLAKIRSRATCTGKEKGFIYFTFTGLFIGKYPPPEVGDFSCYHFGGINMKRSKRNKGKCDRKRKKRKEKENLGNKSVK
jgi:hypothetical protein